MYNQLSNITTEKEINNMLNNLKKIVEKEISATFHKIINCINEDPFSLIDLKVAIDIKGKMKGGKDDGLSAKLIDQLLTSIKDDIRKYFKDNLVQKLDGLFYQ